MSQPYGNGQHPPAFGSGGHQPHNEHIAMQPQPGGFAPQQQGGFGYPQGQPGYGPPGQPGYGPPGQQGYGPPGQQYAPPGQPAYSPPGQPGYAGQQPYAPPGQHGYASPGQQGFGQQPQGPPITNQPGGWMNIPQGIPSCPPGLEYLTSIDQLLVHQKVELLEVFTGFETNNKFTIKNSLGQKVYWAVEENDCCTRNCCGPQRPFDMKILDAYKNQVIHINRPLRCDACCFPCCLQTMEISSPPGSVIGTIEQNWSLCYPNFSLKNSSGETILKIEGPLCRFTLCGDVEFHITTLDGTNVGKISKQWSGLAREMFSDADHFGISFPLDLDVRMKAVCLSALFLIDCMYFEHSSSTGQNAAGGCLSALMT